MHPGSCHFIPPYLLQRLASPEVDAHLARCGHATLAIDEGLRAARVEAPVPLTRAAVGVPEGADWTIHDAGHRTELPGRPVRAEGQPATGDLAVDEAYAGVEGSLHLFRDVYGRDSYDGAGAPVVATVHYGQDYENAFWDGRQLVFGDGDGTVFERFTKPVDVLAHEFTHGVVQHTAGFVYRDQPGALNESVSDAFAACVKQRLLGQDAAEADWLVGEGIFTPAVQGVALRSMADPGTAYDDPVVGSDPQVGHMDDFVTTAEDNGGVHLNSGIPNRAFHLAAVAIGGPSWEGAGRIWYAALTSGLRPTTDFAGFAAATLEVAGEHRAAVAAAWESVGVEGATPRGEAPYEAGAVEVTRSGGFAGMVERGSVALDADDPRAREVAVLVARIDFTRLRVVTDTGVADRFVYSVAVPGQGRVEVPEQALTPELARLVDLVLHPRR